MATAPVDIAVKVKGLSDLQKLERRMQVLEKQVEGLNVDLEKTSKELAELKRQSAPAAQGLQKIAVAAAKAAAAYFTVQKAADLAGNAIRESIARDTAEQQLSILAKQFGEVEGALSLAERASKKFGLGLTETTGQITQVYARLRPLGATLQEVETVFNGFNTAARLGGSTAAEASGAFLQLSQALGSGYLRGQEFNSVAEQAPMVLQAIAKETGLAVGELKEFAAQGGITSDVVLRALKRIETEGAAQLAEAMDTPQQAIKDLQNAAEDLNVEVGRLVQPAVLAFIKELTGFLEEATAQLNEAAKAAEFLGTQLQPLVEIGNAVAGALDGMGVSLSNFVGEIFKALPGIGQLIRAYETLASVTGFLAQQQDNSKGGRNFGADYKAQEQALFEAAGGFSPYNSGGGLSSSNSGAGFGGGASGAGAEAADRVAAAAEREAERVAETLRDREQLVARLEKQLEIENAKTDVGREQLKLELEVLEINQKYDNLLQNETNELIRQNTERARALELEMARMDAAQSIVDSSNFGEMSQWFDEQSAMTKELGSEYEGLANSIAGSMTGAFKSVIDGSKSAEEAFTDMLMSMLDALLNYAMEAIAQYIAIGIARMFAGMGGGGDFGVTPATSGLDFSSAFGGGGFSPMSFFADGGRPPTNMPSIVGEEGPELWIPDSAGTIYNQDQMREAMLSYQETPKPSAVNEPINVNVETTSINGMEFITPEQFKKGVDEAAMKGGKMGEARAMNRLRQSRSTRQKVGI